MEISPDQIIYWQNGPVVLNATLVFTWLAMGILAIGSAAATRTVSSGAGLSRWQNLLEVIVTAILDQIEAAGLRTPRRYLPFIGTLFLFIVTCNMLDVVPGVVAPTASLTTPVALAVCVFVAVPVFGITNRGLREYLRRYIRPSPFMLPFNIIGEVSRTVALAVRLFGNMMSGHLVVAILVSLAPLFFPVAMQVFGLLIGVIQAYVFAVLALVYIASGARVYEAENDEDDAAQPLPSSTADV